MNNKRKFERVEFREPVECSDESGVGSEQETNRLTTPAGILSCDVSEGGMRFYSNEFIPLHKKMRLSFYVGPERQVALAGKVVWIQKVPHSDNYQVGLQFDNTLSDPSANQSLRTFLKI